MSTSYYVQYQYTTSYLWNKWMSTCYNIEISCAKRGIKYHRSLYYNPIKIKNLHKMNILKFGETWNSYRVAYGRVYKFEGYLNNCVQGYKQCESSIYRHDSGHQRRKKCPNREEIQSGSKNLLHKFVYYVKTIVSVLFLLAPETPSTDWRADGRKDRTTDGRTGWIHFILILRRRESVIS